MATATVGILRALLTLDTAQFEGGAKKAANAEEALLKNTERLRTELTKLAPQAERMVKAFSGDKLLYTANNLVAAVTKIGGATKLTEAEQARTNRTLTDAIAKYKALGQTAPKAMLDLQRATTSAGVSVQSITSLASGLASSLGLAFGVGAVTGFAKSITSFASDLKDLSAQTGIGVERIQALNYVGTQAGVTVDELADAVGQLSKRLVGGDTSAVESIRSLGLNVQDLIGMAPDEAFLAIAEEVAKIENPMRRAAVMMELFGRSGAKLLPIVTKDIRALVEATEDSAAVMSKEAVEAADRFDDALHKLSIRARAFTVTLLETVATAGPVKAAQQAVEAQHAFGAATTKAQDAAKKFADFGLKPLSLSMEDVARISTDLDAKAEVLIKRHQAVALAVQRAAEKTKQWREETAEASRGLAFMLAKLQAMPSALENMQASTQILGANTGVLGMAIFGNQTRPVSQGASAQFGEFSERLLELTERAKASATMMRESFGFALGDMLTGARSFKDAFLDVWRSIQRGFADIIGTMVNQWTRQFLGRLLGSIGAGGLGAAIAGGATGAAVGAGAAAVTGGAGAAAGAAAAAGGGVGATLAGLATNPFTIAAAGALGLGLAIRGGLFRGGWEGVEGNRRRDQHLRQWGPPGTGAGSGFMNLAAFLTRRTGQPGGGQLFRDFLSGSKERFESAQASIVALAASAGKSIQAFNMGGFVPPHIEVPAMLHGGSMGELVMPVEKLMRGAGAAPQEIKLNMNLNMSVSTIDAKGVRDFVKSHEFIDSVGFAFEHNLGQIASRVSRRFASDGILQRKLDVLPTIPRRPTEGGSP